MWPMLRSLLNKRFFTLRVWSLIKVIELKGFIWRIKEDSRKMEHIIKRHMIPVPKKKSYFLSRDVTYVTKLVKQTIFHPTRLVTQYALKWLKSLFKEEGKARKMEHIIRRHMIPVPRKKSYFLSRDVTYVTKLVKQTIFHPTRLVTQFALKWLKLNWLIELVELRFSD